MSQEAFVPLTEQTRARLSRCGAATLANALLKRGIRNSFLLGLQPVDPGQAALIGSAWTLRFIPAREDKDSMALYARDDSLHRRAIEECPPGAVFMRGRRMLRSRPLRSRCRHGMHPSSLSSSIATGASPT